MRRTATLLIGLIAVLASLLVRPETAAAGPPCAVHPCAVTNTRWAVSSLSINHYANPKLGHVHIDTWVDEQYATADIGTEPYLYWSVRAFTRTVTVSGADHVVQSVTRVEDIHGHILARNARAVSSLQAPYATQVSPRADVQPFSAKFCGGCCPDSTTRTPLRVRTLVYIRWSDGTLARIARVGPWTKAQWCEPR